MICFLVLEERRFVLIGGFVESFRGLAFNKDTGTSLYPTRGNKVISWNTIHKIEWFIIWFQVQIINYFAKLIYMYILSQISKEVIKKRTNKDRYKLQSQYSLFIDIYISISIYYQYTYIYNNN